MLREGWFSIIDLWLKKNNRLKNRELHKLKAKLIIEKKMYKSKNFFKRLIVKLKRILTNF